jgi:hypothetical protein
MHRYDCRGTMKIYAGQSMATHLRLWWWNTRGKLWSCVNIWARLVLMNIGDVVVFESANRKYVSATLTGANVCRLGRASAVMAPKFCHDTCLIWHMHAPVCSSWEFPFTENVCLKKLMPRYVQAPGCVYCGTRSFCCGKSIFMHLYLSL